LPFTPHRFSPKLTARFGPPRDPAKPIEAHHMDLVAAVQAVFEESVVELLGHLHQTTQEPDLVVGGGSFMNSVVNGKLLDRTPFDRVFVGGSPDDSGVSIGSALWGARTSGHPTAPPDRHNFYGRPYSSDEIEAFLRTRKLGHREVSDPAAEAARLIADGKVLAWFQGGSEFGQRALGHRSILADATRADSKEIVNGQVKYREPFRPFGGSVLEERASELFDLAPGLDPRFMESVVGIRSAWADRIPAITHVDQRVRVHVVAEATDPLFHRLLRHVDQATGAPAVLNTSFNTAGMPLVETPADAVACFATSGLDALVIDRFVLEKPAGPPSPGPGLPTGA
jgi:carbamoyltransferase